MSKRRFVFSILFLLFFSILLLSGCSFKIPKLAPKVAPISKLPAEALFIDKDAIYNQTIALIESAQTSIYVEQAEFDDPRLIQLLLTKSRSGIDVRILLDQWQKVNRGTLDLLKSQNVSIQFYPAQKGQIDHTKYMIIDQSRALIYGPPWTTSGLLAHDLAVELSGRSAWKTATLFSKDWEFTTTFPLTVAKTSLLPEDNIVLALNANVKQQLTEQILTSTKSIWIEISEITEPDLKQSLIDAAAKGRDVRIIVNQTNANKTSDTLATLKENGVHIRYYPKQPDLGMNLAIFDNSSFILSSSGWTFNSFVTNHEFSITVPSPTASDKLGQVFNQDWERSID
ncbi:phosphatidylserine/phosphatidylglycerophosphate/cardiolipin synthase family protein [Desulfosporosinus sp. BG]|uniref:phospholipase D-like domain-containing protein n=1 Tax=Desulfosporosinus sp. BG TaxID=1633135 RepID=UPI0008585695|nr:phosphatidylserine/phosphatidylglycerophosphate/cardiolipin synthase family protein [Desulfosporosinus sp. BG]ODA40572.1 Phosphatidylserine/phosphatidylglycerophosphate/cardiolipin synthase [Desulfosporosinus sp. BG]